MSSVKRLSWCDQFALDDICTPHRHSHRWSENLSSIRRPVSTTRNSNFLPTDIDLKRRESGLKLSEDRHVQDSSGLSSFRRSNRISTKSTVDDNSYKDNVIRFSSQILSHIDDKESNETQFSLKYSLRKSVLEWFLSIKVFFSYLVKFACFIILLYLVFSFIIFQFWKPLFVILIVTSNLWIIIKGCIFTYKSSVASAKAFQAKLLNKKRPDTLKMLKNVMPYPTEAIIPSEKKQKEYAQFTALQNSKNFSSIWNWIPIGKFADDSYRDVASLHAFRVHERNPIVTKTPVLLEALKEDSNLSNIHVPSVELMAYNLEKWAIQQCKSILAFSNSFDSETQRIFSRLGFLLIFEDPIFAAQLILKNSVYLDVSKYSDVDFAKFVISRAGRL